MSRLKPCCDRRKHSGHLWEVLRRPFGRCKLRKLQAWVDSCPIAVDTSFPNCCFLLLWLLFSPNFFLLIYTLIFLVIFNMCVDCARYIWIVSDHVIITRLFDHKTCLDFWFVVRFCVQYACHFFVPRILYNCILYRCLKIRMCQYTFHSWLAQLYFVQALCTDVSALILLIDASMHILTEFFCWC